MNILPSICTRLIPTFDFFSGVVTRLIADMLCHSEGSGTKQIRYKAIIMEKKMKMSLIKSSENLSMFILFMSLLGIVIFQRG